MREMAGKLEAAGHSASRLSLLNLSIWTRLFREANSREETVVTPNLKEQRLLYLSWLENACSLQIGWPVRGKASRCQQSDVVLLCLWIIQRKAISHRPYRYLFLTGTDIQKHSKGNLNGRLIGLHRCPTHCLKFASILISPTHQTSTLLELTRMSVRENPVPQI